MKTLPMRVRFLKYSGCGRTVKNKKKRKRSDLEIKPSPSPDVLGSEKVPTKGRKRLEDQVGRRRRCGWQISYWMSNNTVRKAKFSVQMFALTLCTHCFALRVKGRDNFSPASHASSVSHDESSAFQPLHATLMQVIFMTHRPLVSLFHPIEH